RGGPHETRRRGFAISGWSATSRRSANRDPSSGHRQIASLPEPGRAAERGAAPPLAPVLLAAPCHNGTCRREPYMPNLTINGQSNFADAPPDQPLLWVIREDLRLTGTKYGCGSGLCGSCTVHIDGRAERSCLVTVDEVRGALITTIEGLD